RGQARLSCPTRTGIKDPLLLQVRSEVTQGARNRGSAANSDGVREPGVDFPCRRRRPRLLRVVRQVAVVDADDKDTGRQTGRFTRPSGQRRLVRPTVQRSAGVRPPGRSNGFGYVLHLLKAPVRIEELHSQRVQRLPIAGGLRILPRLRMICLELVEILEPGPTERAARGATSTEAPGRGDDGSDLIEVPAHLGPASGAP